ncbi:MAG: ParA family protein [Gammaproteobacteria bacterium]
MIKDTGLRDLHKIVVINPKGGCGKSTLATNVASSFARRGAHPTLVDCDPNGFSMRWLEKRAPKRPPIHGIEAYDISGDAAEPISARVPPESTTIIFDLPAAITSGQLIEFTYLADSLLVPVMPSAVDVYSATRFIAELLLNRQLDRRDKKLAIVANRVRRNTKSYQMLQRFLTSLKIPVIAEFRDSQNFVAAMDEGIGVCELPPYRIRNDIEQFNALMKWLDRHPAAKRKQAAKEPKSEEALSDEKRMELIAAAAYRRAEERGFQGGDPSLDWIEAEREVDETYQRNMT